MTRRVLFLALLSLGLPVAGMAGVTANALVVAGGGGGGGNWGGGGGGGDVETSNSLSLPDGKSYAVTVGAGGAGSTGSAAGARGANSSFASLTATGGGGGAYHSSTT